MTEKILNIVIIELQSFDQRWSNKLLMLSARAPLSFAWEGTIESLF